MVYICSWPYDQLKNNINPNYDAVTKCCHVFRNHDDIYDSWSSVDSIIQFYGDHNEQFSKYNGIKY
jgi:hypothetical protein